MFSFSAYSVLRLFLFFFEDNWDNWDNWDNFFLQQLGQLYFNNNWRQLGEHLFKYNLDNSDNRASSVSL